MEIPESISASSCKYVVVMRFGRWRVLHDDQEKGAFPDRDEAMRFACALARDQAEAGRVGVVVVQSEIHEMHCFTPAHAEVAPAARLPPRLRLVRGAE